jgi:hypothetical protein
MLDFNMVPVTVLREVNGKDGALQFVPIRWIDEYQRQYRKLGGGAWCPLQDQWAAMTIFDKLVANKKRTVATLRYDLTDWMVMLVGHDGAFTTSTLNLSQDQVDELQIGPTWRAGLAALSDIVLQEQLADVLDAKRIRALGKRRDLLLNQ